MNSQKEHVRELCGNMFGSGMTAFNSKVDHINYDVGMILIYSGILKNVARGFSLGCKKHWLLLGGWNSEM